MANQPLLKTLQGCVPLRPPFWFMRQAGRYLPEYQNIRKQVSELLELFLTPSLATKVTLQPVHRFHTDAAIVFSDILLVLYGLGYPVMFSNKGPQVYFHVNQELPPFSESHFQSRVAPIYDTVATVQSKLSPEVTLIGFAGAPWTVACYMIEGGKSDKQWYAAKRLAIHNKAQLLSLLEYITEATILYLGGQIEAGAQVIQIFDTWAGVLPPCLFEDFVILPTAKIVSALKNRYPDIPVIGFARGIDLWYEEYIQKIGLHAISLDFTTSPSWAKRVLSPQTVIQGNLDPSYLLVGGTPMLDAVTQIIHSFSGCCHIFNLGHGILPHTPPEHVDALAELLYTYNLPETRKESHTLNL